MKTLTRHGQDLVKDIQDQHGISYTSAFEIAEAVQEGNGATAHFSTAEFGICQWEIGGRTTVGDMFDSGMQAKVDAICNQVASQLALGLLLDEPGTP